MLAGTRHGSKTDVATIVGANLGVSIPVFVLGLILQYVFAKQLHGTSFELPPSGQLTAGTIPEPFYEVWGIGENTLFEFISNIDLVNAVLIWRWDIFFDALRHLILPALALATIPMAVIARMTRSSLLDVLGLDYVRTARAKGCASASSSAATLRNSLLPVVTIIGLSLGTLVGGAILTETIFNITGVGKTLFDAISGRTTSWCRVHPGRGHRLRAHQPGHRHRLHVPRPEGAGELTWLSRRSRLRAGGGRDPGGHGRPAAGTVARRFPPDPAQAVGQGGRDHPGAAGDHGRVRPADRPYGEREVLIATEGLEPRTEPCIHVSVAWILDVPVLRTVESFLESNGFACLSDEPQHLMGLDGNARDVFSRIVYGARISLVAGVGRSRARGGDRHRHRVDLGLRRRPHRQRGHAGHGRAAGLPGPAAGHRHRPPAARPVQRRAEDVGGDHPVYARVVRSRALSVREQDFVAADRALGVSNTRILGHRVLPNSLTPLVVQATLGVATAVLELAALSFVGLGGDPDQAEWGACWRSSATSSSRRPTWCSTRA